MVYQSIARLAIAAPVLAKSFNNEILKIKGETVRRVMERTAQFGINNYLARGSHTEKCFGEEILIPIWNSDF